MKTSNAQKVRIGIFTLVGILLFVAGIFLIGSKRNMFSDTFQVYGIYRNVSGLEVGNNIRFAGINVGTIEDIRIVSDTMIRVDMRLKTKVRPFLKKDALASIGSDGLMGDKLVTIAPGSASEVLLLSNGARIMTTDPINYDRIIARFTNVAANAEVITSELAGMAVQIREGKGTISKLIYTDNLSSSLEGTMGNAERITASIAGIADQIRSGRGSLGSLVYTDTLSNRLEEAVQTGNGAMVTIQQAASRFSENMKALQGNFFLRGYFNRKDRASREAAEEQESILETELDEEELRQIISEAQKALDAKQKK